MTRTRQLIYAFWIFVVMMLLWQFYTYDRHVQQASIDHPPQQQHFYFLHTNGAPVNASPTVHLGAYVEQTGYSVKNDFPGQGSFTVYVTLKNTGGAKATSVQIKVRPYRGMRVGDEDAGGSVLHTLSENDPLSQLNQYITFPDLAPGEASTQSAIFLAKSGATPVVPGASDTGVPGQAREVLQPEITFESAKAQP